MSKTLILMVGLPRSGKSTLAHTTGLPVINPDAIRLVLHGQAFVKEAEPMVWTLAKYMVQALFQAGHDQVILDATNTTRKRRDEWKSSAWERAFWIIPTGQEECIRRARADGREDLLPVIGRMDAQRELLDPEEEGANLVEKGLTAEDQQRKKSWLGGTSLDGFCCFRLPCETK